MRRQPFDRVTIKFFYSHIIYDIPYTPVSWYLVVNHPSMLMYSTSLGRDDYRDLQYYFKTSGIGHVTSADFNGYLERTNTKNRLLKNDTYRKLMR
jgi:hypothetical protein